jgi:hypothetical protein
MYGVKYKFNRIVNGMILNLTDIVTVMDALFPQKNDDTDIPLGASKNHVNKYFHTIFPAGEVSGCCFMMRNDLWSNILYK